MGINGASLNKLGVDEHPRVLQHAQRHQVGRFERTHRIFSNPRQLEGGVMKKKKDEDEGAEVTDINEYRRRKEKEKRKREQIPDSWVKVWIRTEDEEDNDE